MNSPLRIKSGGGVEYVGSMQAGAEAVARAAVIVVWTLDAWSVSQAGPFVLEALNGSIVGR